MQEPEILVVKYLLDGEPVEEVHLSVDDSVESRLVQELVRSWRLPFSQAFKPGIHEGLPLLLVRLGGGWKRYRGYTAIRREFLEQLSKRSAA